MIDIQYRMIMDVNNLLNSFQNGITIGANSVKERATTKIMIIIRASNMFHSVLLESLENRIMRITMILMIGIVINIQ
jgi:hypothetical protein